MECLDPRKYLAYQLQFAGTKYLKIAKEVKKSILGLGDVKCCTRGDLSVELTCAHPPKND